MNGLAAVFILRSDYMFDKVLTICSKCKKHITVKCDYKDRNKEYTCKECSNPFFEGYKPEKLISDEYEKGGKQE